VLLRCYLGAAGREAVVDEPDGRLVALARADLAKTMGIDATPRLAVVARWPKAMPQYPPGHLERLDAMEAGLASLPGLALAGAGYRGVGIPDCVRQGTEAARRIVVALARRAPGADREADPPPGG
jgi:oxygen-dependent protoporphyrinogen oxidase